MQVYIIRWRYLDKSGEGIVGVFDDDEAAYKLHDALEQHGDKTIKQYVVDAYNLNEVQKGN